MLREMLRSKIHRATVTEADLNYVGSITIDLDLMEKADMLENEKVSVLNINNGQRFDTYVQTGPRGSGKICLNGAAARLVQPGDLVIIIAYELFTKEELKTHQPTIVLVDDNKNLKYRILRHEQEG
jgi:aspartate 1-decarboxylase